MSEPLFRTKKFKTKNYDISIIEVRVKTCFKIKYNSIKFKSYVIQSMVRCMVSIFGHVHF